MTVLKGKTATTIASTSSQIKNRGFAPIGSHFAEQNGSMKYKYTYDYSPLYLILILQFTL